jgi:hypothetical protein
MDLEGNEEESTMPDASTSAGAEDVNAIVDNFDDQGGFADLFHFIPHEESIPVGIRQAGPGPSTQAESRRFQQNRFLDDNKDSCFVQEHPDAGRLIRMDSSLHEKWRAAFLLDLEGDFQMEDVISPNTFEPFVASCSMGCQRSNWKEFS